MFSGIDAIYRVPMGARQHLPAALALIAVSALVPACRDARISYYTVPREKDPEMPGAIGNAGQPPTGMADTAVPTAAGPALAWTAPAQWVAKPPSAMRKGSYSVPGADGASGDLSITAFPGNVGGELANVNRWRGQVGLAPIGDADLQSSTGRLDSNGLDFIIVDLEAGEGSKRLLGAIVPFGDGTWFFKLTGPDALVAGQRAAFLAFLRTVKPAAGP
jgi:hypothetical protein